MLIGQRRLLSMRINYYMRIVQYSVYIHNRKIDLIDSPLVFLLQENIQEGNTDIDNYNFLINNITSGLKQIESNEGVTPATTASGGR